MTNKKIISTKMKFFMSFLLVSSIICFSTAFIQLYYSNFKLSNYFNVNESILEDLFNKHSVNRTNTINGDEIFSKTFNLNEIDNINIDFNGYTVFLKSYPGDTLSLYAYSNEGIQIQNNNDFISSNVDNKTLNLLPSSNLSSVVNNKKNIDFLIKIPYSYSNNLSANLFSGSIKLDNLTLKSLNLKSISSDISLSNITCETSNISNTNGNITTNTFRTKDLYLNTINGNISSTELSGKVMLSTVNGNVSALISPSLTNIDINTTSGEVYLSTPNDSNLSINYSTVNGDFYKNKDNNKQLNKENVSLTLGDGSTKANIKTVSGNLNLSY